MPSEVTAHCVRDNIGENIATFAVDCGQPGEGISGSFTPADTPYGAKTFFVPITHDCGPVAAFRAAAPP